MSNTATIQTMDGVELFVVRNASQKSLLIGLRMPGPLGREIATVRLNLDGWRALHRETAGAPPPDYTPGVQTCRKCGDTEPASGWAAANQCVECTGILRLIKGDNP